MGGLDGEPHGVYCDRKTNSNRWELMGSVIGRERIDEATLRRAVCALLHTQSASLAGWDCTPLSYDIRNPVSGGLFRVAGHAIVNGRAREWSLIVKGVRPSDGVELVAGQVSAVDGDAARPERFNNWEREVLAYRSGILSHLPPGIAAARCVAVVQLSPVLFQLWLEEIHDDQPPVWRDVHYRRAARQLGRFNGAYLAGLPLPADSWLAYGWLPSFVDLVIEGSEQRRHLLGAAMSHALFRDAYGLDIEDRVNGLFAEAPSLLDDLARLPRTLCHRDAFPGNLFFGAGSEEMMAIDWACVGIGPVGEELAPLVTQRPAGQDFRALEEIVIPAYLEGLAAAGWYPDESLVRFGYAATAVLRYLLMAVAIPAVCILDPSSHRELEERRGKSIEQFVREEAEMVHYLFDLLDEVRALRPSLPL